MWKRLVAVGLVAGLTIAAIIWKVRSHDDSVPAPAPSAAQTSRPRGQRVAAVPAALSGHVARKAGGPIAGAVVALVTADNDLGFTQREEPPIVVTTDAAGEWTIAKVPPGTYVVSATANGCLPARVPKLSLAGGESRTGIDLVLEPGGTLVSGTVSDVGGGPIGSARVNTTIGRTFEYAHVIALTNTMGHYELSLPDGEYELRADHDDYTSTSRIVYVHGNPVTANFVLVPGAVVRGEVVARDTGKPVPGAWVSGRLDRGAFRDANKAAADGEGKFALRSLRPGALAITAVAPGYATRDPASVQVSVGEQVDGVRLVLDRALSIRGRIIDKTTKAGVAGAHVYAFSFGAARAPEALELTGEDGVFEIPGIKPATYTVWAEVEGKVPEGRSIEVKDKDVTGVVVELSDGATLSGRVDPPRITDIHVSLAEEPGIGQLMKSWQTARVYAQSVASGAFELKHVPAGKLELTASADDGTSGELPVTVTDRDQAGLVVRLEAHASISGRVIDTNGAPVPDMTVRASRIDDVRSWRRSLSFTPRWGRPVTARDGTFQIVGLEPGRYDVEVDDYIDQLERAAKMDTKPRNVVELAAATARTGVTITVEARDGVIRGTVVDGDGKPVADAWVTVAFDAGEVVRGMELFPDNTTPLVTNSDGKFTADHLHRGAYRVVVEGPRGASRGQENEVKTGSTITIRLASLGTLAGHATLRGAPVAAYDLACHSGAGDVARRIEASDGAYRLIHIAPGHYRCSAESNAGVGEGEIDVSSGTAQLDLQIDAWATLTGTIVDAASGAPLPDLAVAAVTQGSSNRSYNALISGGGPMTNQLGRFRIDQVASGGGVLMVLARSGSQAALAHEDYKVEPGQLLDLGAIKVTLNAHDHE